MKIAGFAPSNSWLFTKVREAVFLKKQPTTVLKIFCRNKAFEQLEKEECELHNRARVGAEEVALHLHDQTCFCDSNGVFRQQSSPFGGMSEQTSERKIC